MTTPTSTRYLPKQLFRRVAVIYRRAIRYVKLQLPVRQNQHPNQLGVRRNQSPNQLQVRRNQSPNQPGLCNRHTEERQSMLNQSPNQLGLCNRHAEEHQSMLNQSPNQLGLCNRHAEEHQSILNLLLEIQSSIRDIIRKLDDDKNESKVGIIENILDKIHLGVDINNDMLPRDNFWNVKGIFQMALKQRKLPDLYGKLFATLLEKNIISAEDILDEVSVYIQTDDEAILDSTLQNDESQSLVIGIILRTLLEDVSSFKSKFFERFHDCENNKMFRLLKEPMDTSIPVGS